MREWRWNNYGALIDLTGKKFGKLTVIEKDIKRSHGSVFWICQCDCGTIKSINGACLRRGDTKSCGCDHHGFSKLDLLGRKFGKLIVIKESTPKQNVASNNSYWLCKCDCGKEIIVRGNLLTSGATKSCGCARRDTIFKNLTNKTFGLLTAIEPTEERASDGSTIWLCLCQCGNVTKVSVSNLLNNHVKSCGCHRISFGEQEIASLLKQNNINFKREYTFYNLTGDKGGLLRFDFCIFNEDNTINRLVEFQGQQHYQPVKIFSSPEINDKIKKEYCLNNNIILICIPYWIQNKITLNDIFSDKYKIIANEGD